MTAPARDQGCFIALTIYHGATINQLTPFVRRRRRVNITPRCGFRSCRDCTVSGGRAVFLLLRTRPPGYVLGMQITGTRIVLACWIAFNGIGTAITIKLGLPLVLAQFTHELPSWITDPTTVWVGFVLIVTTIGVLLILAPWKSSRAEHERHLITRRVPDFSSKSKSTASLIARQTE
jgi:hypothetical protein